MVLRILRRVSIRHLRSPSNVLSFSLIDTLSDVLSRDIARYTLPQESLYSLCTIEHLRTCKLCTESHRVANLASDSWSMFDRRRRFPRKDRQLRDWRERNSWCFSVDGKMPPLGWRWDYLKTEKENFMKFLLVLAVKCMKFFCSNMFIGNIELKLRRQNTVIGWKVIFFLAYLFSKNLPT